MKWNRLKFFLPSIVKLEPKKCFVMNFLNSDRTKQKTVFSNGISVEVDFKNNTYQIVEKGNSTD